MKEKKNRQEQELQKETRAKGKELAVDEFRD